MSSTALFLHIPVDSLEIVNGPSDKALYGAYIRLLGNRPDNEMYEEFEFTFKTAASSQTFKRKVKLACIWPSDSSGFLESVESICFTGIFFNKYIEGSYEITSKTGELQIG